MAQQTLRGKVCLVTGSSSGLGKATALGLAKLGATVILWPPAGRTSVTVLAIHPGLLKSNLMREAASPIRWITSLLSTAPEIAAETVVYYAAFADMSGRFVKGRQTIQSGPYTQDQAVQKRLWEMSLALTHLG